MTRNTAAAIVFVVLGAWTVVAADQTPAAGAVEKTAMAFLEANRSRWRDLNVPESDGQALHDIIVKRGYTKALEIGTSTGRSGIWIGLALAKTGGRLITIDIDPDRYAEALRNFAAAGVAPFIDARLGDAHDLVPRLAGPFDFVFIDADKEWYTNYAKAVLPKLLPGGCLAAHNVYLNQGWRNTTGEYHAYVSGLANLETTVTSGGLATSYKKSAR